MTGLNDLETRIIVSANRALSDAVTPHLRAITFDYDSQKLLLRGYYDTGVTDDEKEILDRALAEIAADLWQDIKEFYFEAIDKPFPVEMECLKDWLFYRS